MADNKTTNPREIIIAVLRRMSREGESHEMAARWIMEALTRAGWELKHALKPSDWGRVS
jgi:hypothetical protein